MTDPEFRFEKLRVRRFRGVFEPGLSLKGLEGGVNVVYGPNASGKSTVARAIQHLIWPALTRDTQAEISGEFVFRGDDWEVELMGDRAVFRREGQLVESPFDASVQHRDRYYLHLPELLEKTDRQFAEAIRREAVGGYDLAGAGRHLGFEKPHPRSNETSERLETAKQAYRRARDKKARLYREQKRLEKLRTRIQKARSAATETRLLNRVLELKEKIRAQSKLEKRLGQFPEQLARMQGGETRQLERLKQKLSEYRVRQSEAKKRVEAARSELDDSPLADEGISVGAISAVRTRLEEWAELRRQIRAAEQKLGGARRVEASEWNGLSDYLDRSRADQFDKPDLEALESTVRRAEKLRQRHRVVSEARTLLSEQTERTAQGSASRSQLRRAIEMTEQWLAAAKIAETKAGEVGWGVRAGLIAAATVVAGVALWIGVFVHPGGWGLLAVVVLLIYVLNRMAGTTGSAGDLENHEKGVEALEKIDSPAEWTIPTVQQYRAKLFDAYARAESRAQRRDLRNLLETKYAEIERDIQEATEHEDVPESVGSISGFLSYSRDQPLFYFLVSRLQAWRRAFDEVNRLEAELDKMRGQKESIVQEVRATFENLDLGPIRDLPEARQKLERLEHLRDEQRRAENELTSATEKLESVRRQRLEYERQLEQLLEPFGFQPGEIERFERLCRQLTEFREIRDEFERLEATIANLKDQLRREFELSGEKLEEYLAMGIEKLRRRRNKEASKAEKKEQLESQRADLEARIENAKKSRDVEKHLGNYRDAVEQLRREQRRDLERVAGWTLVEHLQKQSREAQLPDVFRTARQYFSRITGGRYQLKLTDKEPPGFSADDTVEGKEFELGALSSGTRVQLLLSVRIAFLEEQENGVRLPLVLDETLANSDDARARAIIEAVQDLVDDRRQVFYLTAQRDEVDKWRRHSESNGAGLKVLALPEASGSGRTEMDETAIPAPADSGLSERNVPQPGGMTHAEYGQLLAVPAWHPREPVEKIHLWYLLENLSHLHRCLKRGIERWGAYETFHEFGGKTRPEAADSHRRAKVFVSALEAYRRAWKIGRGKPVQRSDLRRTEAVTQNFIEEVTAICERVGGDARGILRALADGQVKRFQSSKRRQLEAFFQREGFLDERDRVGKQQLWHRIVGAVDEALQRQIVDIEALERLFERVNRSLSGDR